MQEKTSKLSHALQIFSIDFFPEQFSYFFSFCFVLLLLNSFIPVSFSFGLCRSVVIRLFVVAKLCHVSVHFCSILDVSSSCRVQRSLSHFCFTFFLLLFLLYFKFQRVTQLSNQQYNFSTLFVSRSRFVVFGMVFCCCCCWLYLLPFAYEFFILNLLKEANDRSLEWNERKKMEKSIVFEELLILLLFFMEFYWNGFLYFDYLKAFEHEFSEQSPISISNLNTLKA